MDGPATVLVIDDERTIREALEAQLTVGSFRVVGAVNGPEGIAKAQALVPDTILLDVMMPGMDGFETCRILKADSRTRHVPIIILTALNDKEHVAQGLDAGADEFMTKPVVGLELRARVRSMLRIKRQQDELQAMMALREDLVHMLVHDMRTPLTVIKFCAAILEPTDPSLREDFDDLLSASERLHRLIDEMLLIARLDAGRMLVDRDDTDIAWLLDQVLEAHRRSATEAQIHLRREVPTGSKTVSVDAEIMVRVLDNLVLNALKCSSRGSEVLVRASQEGGRTRFEVVDAGPGVLEEHREKIFEKFEMPDLKRRGVRQTGLGLSFCKLAVLAHGGTIRVEPGDPRGSVFIVELSAP